VSLTAVAFSRRDTSSFEHRNFDDEDPAKCSKSIVAIPRLIAWFEQMLSVLETWLLTLEVRIPASSNTGSIAVACDFVGLFSNR
jgi:hypothetical protein